MEKIQVRDAIRAAIDEELLQNKDVFLLGEEVGEYMGAYKVSGDLYKKHNKKIKRVLDTPITEHGFTGIAVGAAYCGLRPIVEYMTFNFAMQAIDQIINSAAKTFYMSGGTINCPIVFRGPNGAASGVAAQHSQCFASIYSQIPGLKVVSPYFAQDHKKMLKASIRDNNPVIFLENEILYSESHEVNEDFYNKDSVGVFGKANIVRDGSDITIISFSRMVGLCISACEKLLSMGIKAELIDLISLRPIDRETIVDSVKKTNKAVVVEEGFGFCGIGSAVSSIIMEECFDYLDSPVIRVCGKDVPTPYAKNMEAECFPSINEIVRVSELVFKSKI